MSQIKPIKINDDGLFEEAGSSDDITFATVTGATQLSVTGGVIITQNIAFTNPTHTIAGIESQNLMDKTADTTISGNYTIQTGSKLILEDLPTLETHAVNKSYVDAIAKGVSWQDAVLDFRDFVNAEPAAPSIGDRYINLVTGNSSITNQPVIANVIYTWNGTSWTNSNTEEGWATYVDSQNRLYVFSDTGNWVSMGTVIDHNALSNKQGGNGVDEFYHLTSSQATFVSDFEARGIPTDEYLASSENATITADFTFTGQVDVSGGSFNTPLAAAAFPVQGGLIYEDNKLKAYNDTAAAYLDVGASGTASSVVTTFTAGAVSINALDLVYISDDNTISPANATNIDSRSPVGFAPAAITSGAEGLVQENGLLLDVLTGALPNVVYYMGETDGLLTDVAPTTSGAWVLPVGFSRNATDLQIKIGTATRRA